MRPLRLDLHDFGAFRQPTTVDFSDVDYLALVGPTGAGKSTILDGLCFALYGTVPRWGKENVVALALAPSATVGRVTLVFEVAGRRYAAARVLGRDAKGRVTTREARLDALDGSVPLDADLVRVLEAVEESLAEGEQVSTAVERLTGLAYRHFTQCVVLPQGRFAEFLHAPASKRQELLVQLLDAGVYEAVGNRARELAKESTARAALAREQAQRLAGADAAAEERASARVTELASLRAAVAAALEELGVRSQARAAADQALSEAVARRGPLAALRMPPGVPELAERIAAADKEVRALVPEVEGCEADERDAESARDAAGDPGAWRRLLQAYEERVLLVGRREAAERAVTERAAAAEAAAQREAAARAQVAAARDALEAAQRTHRAAELAAHLVPGLPCPVCQATVDRVPAAPLPADLAAARAALSLAERAEQDRRREAARASGALASARAELAALTERHTVLDSELADGWAEPGTPSTPPDREGIAALLAGAEAADQRLTAARAALRDVRERIRAAGQRAARLREEAQEDARALDRARDSVVALGAPAVQRDDLRAAWETLLRWRDEASAELERRIEALRTEVEEAVAGETRARAAAVTLLERGAVAVPSASTPPALAAAVATAEADARNALDRVRQDRREAQRLEGEVAEHTRAARLAHELGVLLKANNFEKWLCGEALEALVDDASATLRELSGGQYTLTSTGAGEIEVVDHNEAAARRSVRTLSGGETFQAALALALALSRQVAGYGTAASRSLDSIFLDEGFGTLDPATLDAVATTLERLAADGDRLVGVVTHVPALAERVPVRFEVTRDGRGSHVRRVNA